MAMKMSEDELYEVVMPDCFRLSSYDQTLLQETLKSNKSSTNVLIRILGQLLGIQ
jgi:hypothetical protein